MAVAVAVAVNVAVAVAVAVAVTVAVALRDDLLCRAWERLSVLRRDALSDGLLCDP